MSKRTSHPAGMPSWIDLATTDVDAVKPFYAALFGWSYTDMPMGPSYTQAKMNGAKVAGMMPMMPAMQKSGHPSMWSTYINVDSAADMAAKAVMLGGEIVMPATDVMGQGQLAVIRDTAGAVVGLWQPMSHIGSEIVNEPGAYTWAELAVRDVPTAKTFYSAMFGWTFEADDTDIHGEPYTNIVLSGRTIGGLMPIGESWGEVPPFWGAYLGIDDLDAALEKTTKLGGKIVMPPIEIPKGRFAGILDPSGAMITMIQLNEWPDD